MEEKEVTMIYLRKPFAQNGIYLTFNLITAHHHNWALILKRKTDNSSNFVIIDINTSKENIDFTTSYFIKKCQEILVPNTFSYITY